MVYLSSFLNKKVYSNGKYFGKIIDIAVFESRPHPPVSKIEILSGKKKLTISPQALRTTNNRLELISQDIPLLPYDHKDFYLVEDLLDKQVIDTDGRRLVRVNDVSLDETGGEMKATGIDIGINGILRRLGVPFEIGPTTLLPWSVIEAFDYQTGDIKIKLKQTSLNTLHPADLADLLEEVGTKERLGIVEALEVKKAAQALEETDEKTQVSILENLEPDRVRDVVNTMHLSEIADVFRDLNPKKLQEFQLALGEEKAQQIKRLLKFSRHTAGGLMRISFFAEHIESTIGDILPKLKIKTSIPETIIATDTEGKVVGLAYTKNLIAFDQSVKLGTILDQRRVVSPQASLKYILRLFANYNLRTIPVVDKEKKPLGIILIDDIVRVIEAEENRDEDF